MLLCFDYVCVFFSLPSTPSQQWLTGVVLNSELNGVEVEVRSLLKDSGCAVSAMGGQAISVPAQTVRPKVTNASAKGQVACRGVDPEPTQEHPILDSHLLGALLDCAQVAVCCSLASAACICFLTTGLSHSGEDSPSQGARIDQALSVARVCAPLHLSLPFPSPSSLHIPSFVLLLLLLLFLLLILLLLLRSVVGPPSVPPLRSRWRPLCVRWVEASPANSFLLGDVRRRPLPAQHDAPETQQRHNGDNGDATATQTRRNEDATQRRRIATQRDATATRRRRVREMI